MVSRIKKIAIVSMLLWNLGAWAGALQGLVVAQEENNLGNLVVRENLANVMLFLTDEDRPLNSYSTMSDALGWYRFEEVPRGTYLQVALADGYEPYERRVTIADEEELTLAVGLTRTALNSGIKGFVTDLAGNPIHNARGQLEPLAGQDIAALVFFSTGCSADGSFEVEDVPPGFYEISITAVPTDGFFLPRRVATIEVMANNTTEVELRVDPSDSGLPGVPGFLELVFYRGVVLDAVTKQRIHEGTILNVVGFPANGISSGTFFNGSFNLGTRAGFYLMITSADGYEPFAEEFSLLPGDDKFLIQLLERKDPALQGSVALQVEKELVTQIDARLTSMDDPNLLYLLLESQQEESESNGIYLFPQVKAGHYLLEAAAPGSISFSGEVEVTPGQSSEISIVLESAGG